MVVRKIKAFKDRFVEMVVSGNRDAPKSSILVGLSMINQPFGYPSLWKTPNAADNYSNNFSPRGDGIAVDLPRISQKHALDVACSAVCTLQTADVI